MSDFTLQDVLDWARTKEKAAYVLPELFGEKGTWYDDAISVKRGKKPVTHFYPKGLSPAASATGKLATFGEFSKRLAEAIQGR